MSLVLLIVNFTRSRIYGYTRGWDGQEKVERKLAYVHRGKFYAAQKKLEQALLDLTKAINIDPKLIEAYIERAKVYESKGARKKAAEDQAKISKMVIKSLHLTV